MKLSNFLPLKTKGDSVLNYEYFAQVTVTTRPFLCRKVENKIIHRRHGEAWSFVDSGEFTPGLQAEKLERAYLSQKSFSET